MHKFVDVKLLKRIFAVIGLFLIWGFLFHYMESLKKDSSNSKILIPNESIGVIQINPKLIFSDILKDFTFKNTDPKILKIVGEYYRNYQQSTQKYTFPIRFDKKISLIKVKYGSEFIWFMAGEWRPIKQKKRGVILEGIYYEPLALLKNLDSDSILKIIDKKKMFYTEVKDEQLSFGLYTKRKIYRKYILKLNGDQMLVTYNGKPLVASLTIPKNKPTFHVTASLNQGGLLPKTYTHFRNLTHGLTSFSINYYGAAAITRNERESIIANFDLLLNFDHKINNEELENSISAITGGTAEVSNNFLSLIDGKYRIHKVNDSTIFIGAKKPKYFTKSHAFMVEGSPNILTNIQNLGWKVGLLEMIPEYRAIKDFSNSISTIKSQSIGKQQQISISFEKDLNARLEIFRMLLTVANAYQFEP